MLEKLTRYNPVIYAQIGNMDRAEVTDWLAKQGWNTHLCVRELAPGVALMGLGGSTFTPFGTPSEFPRVPLCGLARTHVEGGPDVSSCGAFRAYASA